MITRSALFSEDGTRRYMLVRSWSGGLLTKSSALLFVGLNPSTADDQKDDATIRRLIGFTKRANLNRLIVCNVFSVVSSDPRDLLGHPDPVGKANIKAIMDAVQACSIVVVGWGTFPLVQGPGRELVNSGVLGTPIHCFGKNQDGSPKHPLYLPRNVKLEVFRPGSVQVSALTKHLQ